MPPAAALVDDAKPRAKRKASSATNEVLSRVKKVKAEPKESLNLRVDKRTRALIDRAAEVTGQTRTDFMVMSAREKATEVLLNQTLFRLPEADWNAFVAVLDNPPPANAALKKLLAEKAAWEQ
jgi:uncharacterized protein (DUF1778 family)